MLKQANNYKKSKARYLVNPLAQKPTCLSRARSQVNGRH
jgi:hypothetical protein